MSYNEFQPAKKGRCDCGATLHHGDDLRYPEWIGGDPDCSHTIMDTELQDVCDELDEIINKIDETEKQINTMPPFDVQNLFRVILVK